VCVLNRYFAVRYEFEIAMVEQWELKSGVPASQMPVCIYCGKETEHLVSMVSTCPPCEEDLEAGHKPPYKRDEASPKVKAQASSQNKTVLTMRVREQADLHH
jgi:hypothetical protein